MENSIEEDIKELKEMIDSDIESVGGVEGLIITIVLTNVLQAG